MIDENFKELFRKIKISGDSFNFFDIIYPKETIISEWLAFLFNPIINGVGNATINKLLESLNIDYNVDELDYESTKTEVMTDKGRRMDIVIKYFGLWIVIENKIESSENNAQTEDYYEYIERIKENNKIVYIYLKPNYNWSVPQKNYIHGNGFRVLTYNILINKLKEISEFEYVEKDKYKYLKEFLISGERFMKNEEIEYSDAVKFYMDNTNKFNAIEEEYKKQNRKVHEKLRYDILNYINDFDNEYKTDDDISISPRSYIQYYKNGWRNESHNGIHFEIMFHTDKILSSNINCDIVLHLEGKVTNEDIKKLEIHGITKKRNVAFDSNKNKMINIPLKLNFSTMGNYDNSVKLVGEKIKELIDNYSNIMSDVFE